MSASILRTKAFLYRRLCFDRSTSIDSIDGCNMDARRSRTFIPWFFGAATLRARCGQVKIISSFPNLRWLMAVFTTEEGRLILGYMLEADEMLEDRKTMQCSCAKNDVSLNYCPDCGIPNSPCRLLQAFLPHYYGRPKALNRGRPSNIPEVTFHEHRVTKTHLNLLSN
jgi:hypothetical protein